ncbi:MAG: type 4a pilus biogenesis protein PilO [bacterium]|nr:type 4a pilus biogenesis protein PilO [bacterium]
MKASTKRILSIGAAFLLLIGALLVYQNLIRPLGEEIDKKRSEANAKGSLFQKQSNAVQQAQDLIDRSKNLGAIEDTVSLAIPNTPATTNALSQIEAIARLNNVILSGIDVKSIVPRKTTTVNLIKDLGVVEVNVNISGAYPNLKAFLRSLETNVRVANVKEFNFRSSSGSGIFTMNLVVEFYYQNI